MASARRRASRTSVKSRCSTTSTPRPRRSWGQVRILFSLDANSANHIQTNHINSDRDFRSLVRILQRPEYGPATPEDSPGKTNAVGWGTLAPALDDSGQPLKNLKGTHAGRIEYIPVFHPDIQAAAGQLVARITGGVKDDHTLGADVTGLKPKVTDPPNPALAGLMWNRQDGSSSVQNGIGGSLANTMTLKQVGPQNGLEISATVSGSPEPAGRSRWCSTTGTSDSLAFISSS